MQIDNIPPSPDKSPAPATPSLQEVIASIKPALDAHPIEQKIPSAPLSRAEFEEAAEQARAAGLKVFPHPTEHVVIGGEFVQRSTLVAGRVGVHKERRVLSVLYRSTNKKLRAFIFYPSHRIDARKLGKWIFWGVTNDVPENLVQSEIVSMEEFFRINACDYSRLLKDPAIVYEVDKARTELNKVIAEAKMELRRSESSNDLLCKKLDEKTEAFERLAASFEEETGKAYRWQMTALFSLGFVLVAVMFISLSLYS
jgi:uncharacterized coiled-coil protein SlyX